MKSKQSLKLAVLVLTAAATLTSCEDVLGHWDAPAPPGSTTLTITSDDLKLFVGDSETRVGTASSGATVSYSTSDANVATVDANGKVTAVANGTATITASVPFYNHYYGASATYKVVVSTIDVRLNPLYYVAEKDVESISAGTPKVVTFDSGEPNDLTGKTQYKWSEAMGSFANGAASYDTYWDASTITDASNSFTYHLPCLKEWNSIIPADFTPVDPTGNCNPNIFGDGFYKDGGYVFTKKNSSTVDWPVVTCMFGYDATTKTGITDNSYWNAYSAGTDVRYAIRFLGTDHCSVWKYQTIDNGSFQGTNQYVLVVTAKIIDKLETTDTSLESVLNEYMAKDDDWWDYNNENAGAVQRKFYTLGYCEHNGYGSDPKARDKFNEGRYWSTTNGNRGIDESAADAEARALSLGDKDANLGSQTRTDTYPQKFTVRLFRK